jgi:hypothetical protein
VKRILFYAIALAALVGAVIYLNRGRSAPADAIAGVASDYIECSAYYQRTADVLLADGDVETMEQYRDRASLALETGAALSGKPVLELLKDRNRLVVTLFENQSDLGELASRYDDRCIPLLDE